jgi:Mrp family chromosome partitioning ATPase
MPERKNVLINIEEREPDQNDVDEIQRDDSVDLRDKIKSYRLSSEQISNMQEPYLHAGSKLTNRKILSPQANSEINKLFGEISYRILRKVHNNAVIMVTSVISGSGNSFFALNLAISITFFGSKTSLLIDCNNRESSSYDHLLSNKETKGLSDYLLSSEVAEDEIFYSTGIPRVRLIPAGTRRLPGEYYGSAKMMELVANVKDRYPERFIIIDAPPIRESAYVPLLSELSDHAIVVVPYGKVLPKDLLFTADIIGEDKLLGFIFNDKPITKIF